MNSCLTELVNLKHLDLSGVYFQQSRIPDFIGSLKQLSYLNLSGAGLSGNIPNQIGNLSNLKVLDLSSRQSWQSQLMADDMAWIFCLSKLEHLDLSGVDLGRAQNLVNLLYVIPSLSTLSLSACGLSMAQIGSHNLNFSRKLSSIKHLDLSQNYFIDQLPSLLLNLTSLAFLDLSYNDLSKTLSFENLLIMIPFVSELYLLGCNIQNINLSPNNLNVSAHSNIQHMDLSHNQIEGRFPFVLTNMSSLLSLDLSGNLLNSSIPVMPNILKLDISDNNLRQTEDVGIWRHCHLKELIVSDNILEREMIGPSSNLSKCSHYALEILFLDRNALTCSIPESLGRLANLRDLDLSFNKLTGPIPEAVGKLKSLQTLYLYCNQLNGSIPESMRILTALREIVLNFNQFTGPVPTFLGRLSSLRVFSVSSNLLNGTIPYSIGQLTKLYLLDVSNNSLQGVVLEDHFANLTKLKYLDVSYNYNLLISISRKWIPPFQLKVVRLGSCNIEFGFPQWVQAQRKLVELVMSNSNISGPLPTWLHLMPIIRVLDLSHNKLTGPLTNLPRDIGSILLLQNNRFTGLFPRWLCNMRYLRVLDLSQNRLTGKIPRCLWNMSLNVMLLGSNRLSGVIPSPLGCNPSLRLLQLNGNNFKGELPRAFGCFEELLVLDLGENKISGNIPAWIGENFTRLSALRLHKNNFIGRIPHTLCKCSYLQILDLAHNNLTGSIPRCFGELDGMTNKSLYGFRDQFSGYGIMMQVFKGVALDYTKTLKFVINLDLSSNKLVGEIPEELTALEALLGLNLSCNDLNGGIPKTIGNMRSLNSLDLSANKLTGIIPSSMAALNFLSHLNLSHNNLSGQIPTGNQLQTLTDPSIYADNTYLCGAPLPKECSTTTGSKNKPGNSDEPNKVWFYLDVVGGFATGFWGIIGVLYFKNQWKQKLFMFCEVIVDSIYVAVKVTTLKMKRGREAA